MDRGVIVMAGAFDHQMVSIIYINKYKAGQECIRQTIQGLNKLQLDANLTKIGLKYK